MQDLEQRARDMLGGATVAGLAGEFGNARDGLDKQLTWARRAFYGSIGFLLISLTPLVFFLFPVVPELLGLGEADISAHTDLSAQGVVGNIFARLAILVPAIWLTQFTARRHASLFRLREHYAYKHSLAASVEGFKHQAPEYKSEIASAVFGEISFNPADRMEKPQDSKIPHPLMNLLREKLGKRLPGND